MSQPTKECDHIGKMHCRCVCAGLKAENEELRGERNLFKTLADNEKEVNAKLHQQLSEASLSFVLQKNKQLVELLGVIRTHIEGIWCDSEKPLFFVVRLIEEALAENEVP